MKKVLIVGCGNIGSKLYKEYASLHPDRYDPKKGLLEKKDIEYDVAFIAVDTPMLKDGSCDLRQVLQAIEETNAKLLVLRSTVPPMTTEKIKYMTGRNIVFCPEFYGTTQHCDEHTFDFNFTIIGGEKELCNKLVQVLQEVYDARHRFCITDSRTAELCKYMENAFLATKVSFCIQFWQIAKEFGVNYAEMRELLLQDSRINRAHTFVYDEHPYWESHCFDKDLPAITKFSNAPFIENVLEFNNKCKEEYKYGKTEDRN